MKQWHHKKRQRKRNQGGKSWNLGEEKSENRFNFLFSLLHKKLQKYPYLFSFLFFFYQNCPRLQSIYMHVWFCKRRQTKSFSLQRETMAAIDIKKMEKALIHLYIKPEDEKIRRKALRFAASIEGRIFHLLIIVDIK